MTNISTKVNFKKPYFIEVLGEEGLTAYDIGEALGAPIENINKKIKRDFETNKEMREWRVIPYGIANKTNGLVIDTYALNLRAAKAFIARWKNHLGNSYLDFLFDCEIVATEITPKLKEENKELKEKLKIAEENVIIHNRKLKKAKKQGLILAPIYERNMFELMELRWEMKQKETLDEVSKLKAEIRHAQKIIKGLANSSLEKQGRLDRKELEKKNNLLKLITD